MYFLRNIACAAQLFHRQGKKKKHPYTNMYACIPACLPFVFYKPEVLEVTGGLPSGPPLFYA